MTVSTIVHNQTDAVAVYLGNLSNSNRNWVTRHVIAPSIFLIASEALALVGIAYHGIAILLKALPATMHLLVHAFPDSMSWKNLYNDHVEPFKASLALLVKAPWQALRDKNLSTVMTTASATIFQKEMKQTVPPTVIVNDDPTLNSTDNRWEFFKENALPLSLLAIGVGAIALAYLRWMSSQDEPESQDSQVYDAVGQRCLAFNDAKFEQTKNGFTCSLNPREVERTFNLNVAKLTEVQKIIRKEIKENTQKFHFFKWIHSLADRNFVQGIFNQTKCYEGQPKMMTYAYHVPSAEATPEVHTQVTCLKYDLFEKSQDESQDFCNEYSGDYDPEPTGSNLPTCWLPETSHEYHF